jgi:hypothetical protein
MRGYRTIPYSAMTLTALMGWATTLEAREGHDRSPSTLARLEEPATRRPSSNDGSYNFDRCVSSLYQLGGISQTEARKLCFDDEPAERVLDCQRKRFFFDYLPPKRAYEACLLDPDSANRHDGATLPEGVFEPIPPPASSSQQTVCSITVNSDDEKKAFREAYSGSGYRHVELLSKAPGPNSFWARDNRWLERACRAQVKCDIVVISGHFAGQFFGSTGFSVDAHDLWKRSCSESCRGLFQDVKEVFLFGCNTLASKVPDPRRSAEDYVRVLHEDGLDPGTSQRLAAQRYTPYGLSFGQRMRWIFPNASIFGYAAGGPTGPRVASRLASYLRGDSFQTSLGRTGMIQVRGENSEARAQFCALTNDSGTNAAATVSGRGTLQAAEDLRLSAWGASRPASASEIDAIRNYVRDHGVRFPVVAWDLVELGLKRSLLTRAEADRLKRSFIEPLARGPQQRAREKLCPILLQSQGAKNLEDLFDISTCSNTDWL